jgi:hypothetical protein
MKETVKIEWQTGSMIINLGFFFPASAEKVKKLLKIISLDFRNEEELIADIMEYLNSEIPRLKDLMKANANLYADARQKMVDCQNMVESKKKPNGVRLTKDELQQVRKDKNKWKAEAKQHEHDFNGCKQRLEKIQRNIELIKNLNER